MSWLPGAPAGATLDDLIALRPGLLADFQAIRERLWVSAARPFVLELARLRIAQLLGCEAELAVRTPEAVADGLTEEHVAALPRWPSDPRFGAAERACLALAEQFALSARDVTPEQVDAVRDALGDEGAVAFTVGLALFEGSARATLALGAAAGR